MARREYALEMPAPNRAELYPEKYWTATRDVIQELLKFSNLPPSEIRALAFSSQGETLIVVDKNGKPLRKAIVWMDNRSEEEAKKIEAYFGHARIKAKTGQPEVVPTWTATKIHWLRKYEPEVFAQAARFATKYIKLTHPAQINTICTKKFS